MKEDTLTFEQAFHELESIVQSLEDNTLTIDDLATRIDRAAKLITFCREKLASTDYEVQKILNSLDPSAGQKASEKTESS